MVFTFDKSKGLACGSSLVEEDKLDLAQSLLAKCASAPVLQELLSLRLEFKVLLSVDACMDLPFPHSLLCPFARACCHCLPCCCMQHSQVRHCAAQPRSVSSSTELLFSSTGSVTASCCPPMC